MSNVIRIAAAAVIASGALSASTSWASGPAPTSLVASPVMYGLVVAQGAALIDFWGLYGPEVSGRLRTEAGGVEGRVVRFSVEGVEICSVATSASGYAACSRDQVLARAADIIAADGYEASFSGDEAYGASSDRGEITSITVGP